MILWNSVVNLEPLGGHFGALWGHFGVLWVRFELTLAQVGRSWCQVGPKLAQLGPKFGPERIHKQIILILSTNFACQDGPEYANRTNKHPAPTVWEGVGGG